jgi:hypothetical protein
LINELKKQIKFLRVLLLLIVIIQFSCKKDSVSPTKNTQGEFELINSADYYPTNNWIQDLSYDDTSLLDIDLDNFFEYPNIDVKIGEKYFPLTFDFGTSGEMWITTEIEDEIEYTYLGETQTLWPDGSYRGTVKKIKIPSAEILGKKYLDIITELADWEIYSTQPFNGAFGLKYLDNRRFTLDYKGKLLAHTDLPFPIDHLNQADYITCPLIDFDYHPYGIHILGEVEGLQSIIYFDTGQSHSWIDKKIIDNSLLIGDDHQYYNGIINIHIGELELQVKYPMAEDMYPIDEEYDYPVRFIIGTNLLKYFVITVDRTDNNNLLFIHR